MGADVDAAVGMMCVRGGQAVNGLHETAFGMVAVSIRAGLMK